MKIIYLYYYIWYNNVVIFISFLQFNFNSRTVFLDFHDQMSFQAQFRTLNHVCTTIYKVIDQLFGELTFVRFFRKFLLYYSTYFLKTKFKSPKKAFERESRYGIQKNLRLFSHYTIEPK